MPSLKASEPGVAKIKQARNEKGWTVEDERWLIRASQVLEPDKTWPMENQEGKNCYFPGISLTTWKRFLQGKRSINTEVFKAFCQVLGLDWEEYFRQFGHCLRF